MTMPGLTTAVPFVLERTRAHDHVASAEALDQYRVHAKRTDPRGALTFPDVTVVAISVANLNGDDVRSILGTYAGIDGIVNSGSGTHYLGDAKLVARGEGIALHTFGEYMSALNKEQFRTSEDKEMTYVLESLAKHRKIVEVEQVCEKRIRLKRDGLSPVEVVQAYVYIFGIVELEKTLKAHPMPDAIVNSHVYGQFTKEALERARDYGVGLFTMKDVFGALYRDGTEFSSYGAKDTR